MPEGDSSSLQQYSCPNKLLPEKKVHVSTHMEVCSYCLYQILITTVFLAENNKTFYFLFILAVIRNLWLQGRVCVPFLIYRQGKLMPNPVLGEEEPQAPVCARGQPAGKLHC